MTLPPVPNADQLGLELRLVPHGDRADALQEAWLAFLAGTDPTRAVNRFTRGERRRRRRTAGAAVPKLS